MPLACHWHLSFQNWYLLRVKVNSKPHPHKMRFWYLLGVFSKSSDEPLITFKGEYPIIFIGEYSIIFIALSSWIAWAECTVHFGYSTILWSCFSVTINLLSSLSTVTPLADYYMLAGVVYQAPDLCSVINSRLVSRQSNSVNRY